MEFCEDCKTCNHWVRERCVNKPEVTCENWKTRIDTTIPHCSFCGKGKKEVKGMAGVAGTWICDVCVENCRKVIGYSLIGVTRNE